MQNYVHSHNLRWNLPRRARCLIPIAVGAAVAVLASTSVFATPVASGGTVTVCSAGPPTCDYPTIQDGIDAATAGDTVLVSSGTYTEQLTLKSGVTLASAEGAGLTTVRSRTSPAITATGD